MAFVSAALLGFYDVFKKLALKDNSIIPVLFVNTLICSAIFVPFILVSSCTNILDASFFHVPQCGWHYQRFILLKSCIVLSSWVFGYLSMKHLPITIVGPINATRPVMVLIGAMLFFGERLNIWQWSGVLLAIVSFFMLSRSGRKEGLDFRHNKWILFLVIAAMLGAISGLYDKYLMAPTAEGGIGAPRMAVQSWYNIYQCGMMACVMVAMWWPKRSKEPFHWHWSILFISLFLSAADCVYFYSLSLPDAMVSIVSMVRRGSVVVSFLCGAMLFREKNLRSKALDLALVLLGMIFLYIGSR